MTFAALAGRTALLATRRRATATAQQQAKRRMGGAAAPEWTGIDKVVRGYFPQDDQRELCCIHNIVCLDDFFWCVDEMNCVVLILVCGGIL